MLAVLVRAAVMLRGPGAFDDPDNYLPLARSLAAGDGFTLERASDRLSPTALSALARPLDLRFWATRSSGESRCLHLGLGAGTVWLTAAAAKGSGLSPQRGHARRLRDRVRPGPGLAEPLGDDRDADGFLAGRDSGRARPAGDGWDRSWAASALGLAALCRPSMLAGSRADDRSPRSSSSPAIAATRLVRGGLLALDDRHRPFALDDSQPAGLRRADLDDDPRRLHPGAGQQPGLLSTMSCTDHRAASGPGTTSGSGGIRSTAQRPA